VAGRNQHVELETRFVSSAVDAHADKALQEAEVLMTDEHSAGSSPRGPRR
jgi:hypothetical protein